MNTRRRDRERQGRTGHYLRSKQCVGDKEEPERRGRSRLGEARRSKARQGKARRGKAKQESVRTFLPCTRRSRAAELPTG
ncbi:hypothetical protein E2C01_100242 [Portunus trituberculatus]|uniref:Uncharacterized protein n=1 Tax=Portunus trituberculatus TaxID=210409 RepID=A0A5B7KH18_PORTR|nr:hypothetical protein [Portunus trituberculatus]